MFFFRNLLFLTSLAFITWISLCLLDHVKENRELPHRLDLSLDNSLGDIVKCEAKAYNEYYFSAFAFFCIFFGFFALGKLIEMVEICFAPNICATFEKFRRAKCNAEEEGLNGFQENSQNVGSYSNLALDMHEETFTLDDYRKMTMSMRQEIGKIYKRNKYLDNRVGELEQQNLLLMGKGLLQAREPGVCFLNSTKGGCDGDSIVVCSGGDTESNIDPYCFVLDGINASTGISVGCSNFVCSYFCDNGNIRNTGGADGDKDHKRPQWVPFQQNIFVGNRFIHISHEMGAKVKSASDCNGTKVWQKYLGMHFLNYGLPLDEFEPLSSTVKNFPTLAEDEKNVETRSVLKKIDFSQTEIHFSPEIPSVSENSEADIRINSNKGLCNLMPVVVTTEELETIQGLGHQKKAVLSG